MVELTRFAKHATSFWLGPPFLPSSLRTAARLRKRDALVYAFYKAWLLSLIDQSTNLAIGRDARRATPLLTFFLLLYLHPPAPRTAFSPCAP